MDEAVYENSEDLQSMLKQVHQERMIDKDQCVPDREGRVSSEQDDSERRQESTKDQHGDNIQTIQNGQQLPQARQEHILDCEDYFSIDDVAVQEYLVSTSPQHSTALTQHSTALTQQSTVLTQHNTASTQHSAASTQHSAALTQHSAALTQHQNTSDVNTTNTCTHTNTPSPPYIDDSLSKINANGGRIISSVNQLSPDRMMCVGVSNFSPAQNDTSDYENSEVLDDELERLHSGRPSSRSGDSDCTHEPVYGNTDTVHGDFSNGGIHEPVYGNADTVQGNVSDEPDYENEEDLDTESLDYENEEDIDDQLFNIKMGRTINNNKPAISSDQSQSDRTSTAESIEHPLRLDLNDRVFPSQDHTHNDSDLTRRLSTLHRESEIKMEAPESPGEKEREEEENDAPDSNQEEVDDFDPASLNRTPSNVASASTTLNSLSSLMLIEKVKSSRGSPVTINTTTRRQPVPEPDLSRLGTFERELLQGKGSTNKEMPNVKEIPWYHEGITRHISEALLLSKAIQDGTYLLRDSLHSNNSLTLSVRCQKSVKHYRIVWDGKQFTFGLGNFPTLESLMEHFNNQPVISGESGILVQLSFPYPRGVAEPAIYFEPVVHPGTGIDDKGKKASNGTAQMGGAVNGVTTPTSDSSSNEKPLLSRKWTKRDKVLKQSANSVPDLSINSKEGYLTKMGHRVKNWKRRWFVLYKNELKYFNTQDNKEPLRVIDLNDVSAVDRDDSAGKSHCLRLVTSYRTFFMYATSDVEVNEWVQILDWKLGRRSRSNSRVN